MICRAPAGTFLNINNLWLTYVQFLLKFSVYLYQFFDILKKKAMIMTFQNVSENKYVIVFFPVDYRKDTGTTMN